MNKGMVKLFFVVVLAAAAYYCYEQGFFNKGIARAEKVLTEICDPAKEECSELDDALEV